MMLRNTWVTTFMLGAVVALSGCSSSDSTPNYYNTGGYGAGGSDGGIGATGGTGGSTGGSGGFGAMGGSGGATGGSGGATGGSGGATGGSGGATGGSGGATGGSGGATGGSGGATGGSGGATGGSGGATGGSGGATGGSGGTSAGGSGGTSAGGTGGTSAGGTGGASTGGTGGASTGGTGGTDAGAGGSGGSDAGAGCTPITVGTLYGQNVVTEMGQISPNIGGTDGDWLAVAHDGTTGTFDLSTETDLTTCTQCVLAYEDVASGNVGRYYFQTSGSMTVSQASSSTPVFSSGSLSNVKLIEVTIDSNGNATPVQGGKCLILNSANWSVANVCYDGGPEYIYPSQSSSTDCTNCENAEVGTGGCCESTWNTCVNDTDCSSIVTCINNCASGDTTCQQNCYNSNPNGQSAFNNVATCLTGDGSTTLGACGLACQ